MAHASQDKQNDPNNNTSNNNTNDNNNEIDNMFIKYTKRINKFCSDIQRDLPVENNNILTLNKKEEIYSHMKQCYPLVHGSVLSIAYHFLLTKSIYGSDLEKKLYSNMTMIQFFDRLATKRAVAFWKRNDEYLLRDGTESESYYGIDYSSWEFIGTNKATSITPSLSLYLSYDELIISAMCGISSPTHFINNGGRRNCGSLPYGPTADKYPFQGIYIGLVGARFEKNNVMENKLMVIDSQQNVKKNGYGSHNYNSNSLNGIDNELDDNTFLNRLKQCKSHHILRVFERFYSRNYFPEYMELQQKYQSAKNNIKLASSNKLLNRYFRQRFGGQYLDRDMFKRRIRVSLELFLFDADRRAKIRVGKMKFDNNNGLYGAYCHIIGLGTGVWSLDKEMQDGAIVEVCCDIIRETNLKYITAVYFAWMDDLCMSNIQLDIDDDNNNKYLKDKSGNKVYIFSGRSNPSDILLHPFDKCLTVSMYAWDSNAFPGNEYYFDCLSASGDPAAASCSTISFIQNSEINKEYISGANTGIYFVDELTNNYQFIKLKDINFENDKQKWLKKSILSVPYKRRALLFPDEFKDDIAIDNNNNDNDIDIDDIYGYDTDPNDNKANNNNNIANNGNDDDDDDSFDDIYSNDPIVDNTNNNNNNNKDDDNKNVIIDNNNQAIQAMDVDIKVPTTKAMEIDKTKCYECNKDLIKNLRCSSCKKVYYCSETCQKTNWKKKHKKDCKKWRKKKQKI